mmetsp:Transcript_20785/g.37861  ORF Transcript_20785/g.37861 Transcript_20785/m.37861 type:complete len:256 (+) Transcript_20785:63-830(+)
MACCPPGSLPYLEATYEGKGEIAKEGDTEMYVAPVTGTPTSAIVMCPDIWGWNGGRVRAVADSFASMGYLVVVGKFLTPVREGGTDGDAMSPTSEFDMDWIKQFPWSVQKPKLDAVLGFVRSKGATKIAVFGFCYGGHPCCWASQENADVVCGVIFHPSIQLEQYAYGGDFMGLVKSVKAPFLICPAGNDVPMYAEESDFAMNLKESAKGSECVITVYPDMTHGFTCRGDVKEEKVARDVDAVFKQAAEFIGKYL